MGGGPAGLRFSLTSLGGSLHLSRLSLTTRGTMSLLARTLVPAGKMLTELRLWGCVLSPTAQLPSSDFGGITFLELHACGAAPPGGGAAAALNAVLQHMQGLHTVRIINCDLSGGLPNMLRQLRNITCLTLHSKLDSLPPLACMPGEPCPRLAISQPANVVSQLPHQRPPFSALAVLTWLVLDGNNFGRLPSLGSAPKLAALNLQHNPNLAMDAASVDRLAAEAPNLQRVKVGGAFAAGARLGQKLPRLTVT